MDLWAKLETITRSLEICDNRASRLSSKPTAERLAQIQGNLFKCGISYTEVCYIKDVADALDVEIDIRLADFIDGNNVGRALTIDRIMSRLIPEVNRVTENRK